MAKLKKLAAICTAAMMTLSMAGCSDTSYVMSSNGENVNAGIYIFNMMNTMYTQMMMMYYSEGITEDYFSQEVDGKSFSDYLADDALQSTKEYVAVVQKFEELGLELTDEELSDLNSQVNDAWTNESDFYESQGVSKESVKLVQKASLMRSKIFDYYYEEGGIEEVTNDDVATYLDENYIRYKQIYIAKSTELDEDVAAEADAESEKTWNEYLEKAQDLTFEEFDDLITEYNNSLNETEETTEDADSADETADTESSSVDETSSISEDESSESDDTSSAAEDSSSVNEDSAVESEDMTTDESASDESTADSETTDQAATEETEEETDPYANETITSYGSLKEEDLEDSYGKLLTEINGLEVGKAAAYEDENGYYILIKGDMSERSADYATENRDNLLSEMKADDFQALLDEWIEAANIKLNDKAIQRYTPEIVYEKYVEANEG